MTALHYLHEQIRRSSALDHDFDRALRKLYSLR
jgi:hypothetical protein